MTDDLSNEVPSNVVPMPDGAPDANGLTTRQRMILECIAETVAERGFPPTMREIGERVGLSSTSSVTHQLQQLERSGFIKRDSRNARSMEIMFPEESTRSTASEEAVHIRLLGTIAAGTGVIADEQVEAVMPLPRELVGRGDASELFMLKVKGDSMIDAAICDGDFVVVRRAQTAENGDIVAALLDGDEATVKTFKRRDGHVWLMPHNPGYAPILGDDARILGIVKTVLRKL
jgi:repressor LexA